MPYDLTHASFFSGVGGLDLGLERAGWRTVSFSEIDPYASAVLAERWPGVPNVGDIVRLRLDAERRSTGAQSVADIAGREWHRAVLWTGGFPCQDLSVAGKRRGFEGERSVLAFAFLDLVERHRPPAILLENVPGLLSSHAGKDFGALLSRLAELGYWWAYRILDAQFFGVPQRRRRVFICALHAGAGFGADSPAEVLSVGARCGGHSAAGDEAGTGASERPTPGVDIARAITGTSGKRHDDDTDTLIANALRASDGHHGHGSPRGDASDNLISSTTDSRGVREADGLARRLDDREVVGTLRVGPQRPQDGGPGDTVPIIAATLNSGGNNGGFRTEPREHLVAQGFSENQRGELRLTDYSRQVTAGGGKPGQGYPAVFVKRARVSGPDTPESWEEGGPMTTLNSFDVGDVRTTAAILSGAAGDDDLLPLGLDSHRYRCCGNGVVAPVSEWIGWRIRAALEGVLSDAA